MAFRYSRSAMTGAAIFTLAGVTVLPLAQANAAPASPQDEARSGSTQSQPNSAAQNGQDQGQQAQGVTQDQQQGANASGQNQDGATQGGATQDPSQAASGGEQQQSANAKGQGQQQQAQGGATQDQQQSANAKGQGQQQQAQLGASQDKQGTNASGQGQQQGANADAQGQGAPVSQSSSNSNSASQNNQSRQSQPSAPAVVGITSVDGFIDPQKTDNSLTVETTGIDDIDRVEYDLRVQELDEFGNIVNDDVSTGGASSINSDGDFGISAIVDGTKINPNHHYRVYIDAFDRDTLTASYAYYPIVVWNRTYIPVVPLSAAQ